MLEYAVAGEINRRKRYHFNLRITPAKNHTQAFEQKSVVKVVFIKYPSQHAALDPGVRFGPC